MTVTAAPELHPADQVHADRLSRAFRRDVQTITADGIGEAIVAVCDHGRPLMACRPCVELRHAEASSVAVRAAYAFGLWPPAP